MKCHHISKVALLAFVTSCTSVPAPHLKDVTEPNLLQTRVAILNRCPASKAVATSESGPLAAIGHALIPPLIDTSVKTVSNVLKELAKERTKTFQAQTVGRFYNSNLQLVADRTQEPYELLENNLMDCIVVVHGYFGEAKKNENPDLEKQELENSNFVKKFLSDDLSKLDPLIDNFGLKAAPALYYEGSLVFSSDRGGFRIRTEAIYYSERLMDAKSGKRETSLNFVFSKPSSDKNGSVFGTADINIGLVDQEFVASEAPFIGFSDSNKSIQTSFGSGFIPLPALDNSLNDQLKAAKTRADSHSEALQTSVNKYMSYGIPGFSEVLEKLENSSATQESIVNEITSMMAAPDTISALSTEENRLIDLINSKKQAIEKLDKILDDDIWNANSAIEDYDNEGESEIDRAKRLLVRAELRFDQEKTRNAAVEELGGLIKRREELKNLMTVGSSIEERWSRIKIDRDNLSQIQPITLTAVISEKRPENKTLSFISSVFGETVNFSV